MTRWKGAPSPAALMVLTVFLDFVGLTIVIPLLPFWAERVGAGPQEIGLLATAYALTQLAFTPVLGWLSDRIGRKPVIMTSLAVEAASFALTAWAGTLPVLLAARLIGGLGASNVGSAQAVVADVTPAADRTRAMGLLGAAIGLAHIVGPALDGLLAGLGEAVPFWAALAVTLIDLVLVAVFLPETLPNRGASRGALTGEPARAGGAGHGGQVRTGSGAGASVGWGELLRRPAVAPLALIGLLVTMASMAMETVFALFTNRRFGWGPAENGWLFALMGALVVLMQAGVVGRLSARLGPRRLLVLGIVPLTAGFGLLPLLDGVPGLLASLTLIGVGTGLVMPTLPALISLATPDEAQGQSLGLAQMVSGLGRLAGPLAAGGLFGAGTALPFFAAAAMCAVSLPLGLAVPGQGQADRSTVPTTPADTKAQKEPA